MHASHTPYLIGICGGTASGKSQFTKQLAKRLQDHCLSISHDAYYLNPSSWPDSIRGSHNFDHPDALDHGLFIKHLKALKSGHDIELPIYDFNQHQRLPQSQHCQSRPIIIVEGILLFAKTSVREQFHLRLFIDTADDIRLARRMQRDIQQRGRSPQSVIEQYINTVRPMHAQFVAPYQQCAHFCIPGNQDFKPSIRLLEAGLRQILTTKR